LFVRRTIDRSLAPARTSRCNRCDEIASLTRATVIGNAYEPKTQSALTVRKRRLPAREPGCRRSLHTWSVWRPDDSQSRCSPCVPSPPRRRRRKGSVGCRAGERAASACSGTGHSAVSAGEFWCGRRGGVSHRRAWKANADALCVAPAPQGGLVPGGDGRSERCGVPQEWWKCLTRRNSSVRAHSSVGRAADS
jgi:hypothetical protein